MPPRDQDPRRRRSERTPTTPEPVSDPEDALREDIDTADEKTLRGKLEAMVPDVVKKAMVSGLGALFVTEETIRTAVSEMRLPKEAASFLMHQADNTKEQLFRHIARELREALEKTNMAEELPKMLSNMTIEVKTEIRFVPNAAPTPPPQEPPPLKTEVRSEVDVKAKRRK